MRRAGKLYLPMDLLNTVNLSPDEIFAGQGGDRLKAVMGQIVARERSSRCGAEIRAAPAGAAGVLPAALVPLYLKLHDASAASIRFAIPRRFRSASEAVGAAFGGDIAGRI